MMKVQNSIIRYAVPVGSAVISCLFLSYAVGWIFAFIYMIGLLIHECGHAFTAAAYDVRVSMEWITPLGAYVRVNDPLEEKQKMTVALAGPLSSIVYLALLYMLYCLYPISDILYAIISLTVVNAVNLLPLTPFDGGKISEAVAGILCLVPAIPLTWMAVLYKQYFLLLGNVYFIVNCFYLMKKKKSLLRFLEQKYHKSTYIICYLLLVILTTAYLVFLWQAHKDSIETLLNSLRTLSF